MSTKTYVLLDSMDADAPVYHQLPDGKRMQVKKIPLYRPYLRITFQDEKGVSQTLRYKSNAVDGDGKAVLSQREQIDKLKIEANDPFTTIERRDLEFRHGILVTNKVIAQLYLESYPACEGFKGTCDDVREPQYKLLDKEAESKVKNSDMRKRVKAANKVIELELEDAQAMLIRLNGSFFETPKDKEECQNLLMEFVDDTNEAGLDAILKDDDETTIDEKTTILIGKLINAEILEFDITSGIISKDKVGNKIELRTIVADSLEEMKRMFSDFLNTADGKPLKNDLENDLRELSDEAGEQEQTFERKKMGRPKKVITA